MHPIAKETQPGKELDELKTRLKATWMTGDYDLFSRYMEKESEPFFRRLGIRTGTGATKVDAEYLEVIATPSERKRAETANAKTRGRRAESLAARIEEGAAGLAAFAEGLSEEEWRTPLSGADRR